MLVQHYLARAQDFLEGMQLLREDETYRASSALLGIHAAVSYSDALRIGLGDEVLAADDHREAVRALRSLLPAKTQAEERGTRHLAVLISKKNAVAYGRGAMQTDDYRLITTTAERFATWANRTGTELQIKGWAHGND